MLSILIPTYNYNVYPLVLELHKQCLECQIEFEILVQDDASKSELNLENEKINLVSNCHFFCAETNLGRGENRNSLANRAHHNWFLFLDCDTFPTDSNFIKNYIEVIVQCKPNVIYGGLAYKNEKPKKEEILRWVYGKKREAKSIEERKRNPSFALTSNLAILSEVFCEIKFDSSIKNYGYEDLIFISELEKNNIQIEQIDNCVYHLNLENSEHFLEKTEIALRTLHTISKNDLYKTETQVTKYYSQIKRYKIDLFLLFIFRKFKRVLKKNLLSNNPSLFVFDLYKLGFFTEISNY
ncbi:MAG: glycosyltransferase family 2 protein [Flavobacterium sp.]|uniref:glycosyltransferase family 2 protein n=1 Tax=Flavobacterium sp. TaxID=239 RepID=UPI0022BEBA4C|nr:glycosyltransferase family 2 protein [Flavobacterium sp.]MCZ8198616.1 glycosyltransferase family 2 protein [Flavobacterium sp.]